MPGTYPFYHNYAKPNDYMLCSTGTHRNFVFDGDRVGTSTRILLGYNNGPILETFSRQDGASFLNMAPDTGPLNFATGNGTWQYQVDPWSISNVAGYPTAFNFTPGTTNSFTVIYNAPWVAGTRQTVAATDSDHSCIVRATSGCAGLMMRSNGGSASNVYYIDIAAGFVKVGVNVAFTGQGTTVFTGTTPIVAGVDYTLRLVNVGNNYTAYLNGVQEGTFTTSVNNGAWEGIWADTITARFTRYYTAKFTNPTPITAGTLTWSVRNYDGDLLDSGTVTDDHVDIPDASLTWRGRGPYGWYRFYITGPDHADGQWNTAYGDTTFYRIRTDSGFAASAPNLYQNVIADNDEYARSTIGGMGLLRFNASSATSGTIAANNAGTISQAPIYKSRWVDLAQSLRPRVNLAAFSDGTVGIESTITATVNAMKTYINAWEPRNEPYYAEFGEGYITNEFDPFRTAVKAADATAKVFGPGPVTFNNSNGGNTTGYIAFIRTFLTGVMSRGGTVYLDGLSVHSYNCTQGDMALTRKTLTDLKTAVDATGYTGPLYQTEQGFDWEYFAVTRPRHGGQWTALHTFMLELYGIPHENNSYWYDFAHGFNDVPEWWLDGPGYHGPGPGPQALPLRTMAAEIGNRTFTAQLDFGTFAQYLYAGGTWTAGDGTKTVGLIAATTGASNLQFNVTGASSLTRVDTWGNTSTITVTGGVATCVVDEMPSWIRLPAGVTMTPVSLGMTNNLATTATIASTGDQTLLTRVNDGQLQNQYYNSNAAWNDAYAPYSDRSNTFPQTVTLNFASPVTANRIIVHSMAPWQELGTLTDFDVDTFDGTTWTTRYSQSLPASKTFLFTGIGKCLVETYWDGRCAWDISFATATFTKVRVVVRACSYGEFETSYVRQNIYGGTLTQYLALREVQVFNVSTSNVGVSPGVAIGVGAANNASVALVTGTTGTKISGLSPLTGANLADIDEFVVVDKSDVTMSVTGTDKKIVMSELYAAVVARNIHEFSGTGSPNGVVTGSVGDRYWRTDGGAGTTLYVKESGTATNTGWVGK